MEDEERKRHLEIRESPGKPGDYVLLRALEDLVVVVTACSVDRGVLNGGEPKELASRSL